MPAPRLSAEARRALQMLAGSPTHCTASRPLAQGFMPELITGLIKGKLATAELKPMKARAKLIQVRQIRISDAGRMAAGTIKLRLRRAQGHRPGNWGPDDYDVLDGTRRLNGRRRDEADRLIILADDLVTEAVVPGLRAESVRPSVSVCRADR